MEYPKNTNDRSDFIGGIDNEAIDFGHLEQFMQVETNTDNTDNINNCNIHNRVNLLGAYNTKTESFSAHQPNNSIDVHTSLSTISGRTSAASTPIATPLLNAVGHGVPKMPDSPPDSGSEPPYSPLQDVHGLALTSRDIYNGLPAMQQSSALQESRLPTQYTSPPPPAPHQLEHHRTYTQLHFAHNAQHPAQCATSPPSSPKQQMDTIHIKHETGLVMEPSILPQQLPHANTITNSHLELQPHQIMFLNHNNNVPNNAMQYENNNFGIYSNFNYPSAGISDDIHHPTSATAAPSGVVGFNDTTRVQLIGTSQVNHIPNNKTSLPTTPVHLTTSRKRKLSTQLDCLDYGSMKPDPGLALTASDSAMTGTLAAELQPLEPISPVGVSLPPHSSNISTTPAHSAASLSPTLSAVNSNLDSSLDGNNIAPSGSDCADSNALTPCIRFTPFQPQNWHKLCDQSLQDIAVVYYRVDADKGFNFSVSDDAFVCQKKNHFQITCHARLQGDAKFVKTSTGLEKINSFHLHFYGVKLEAPNQTIRVEQSQSDRSKKPFYPVPIDLQSHKVSKITVGRLHFSETTNNNMRKKGRPNPEQRYFQLVVGLHVHTISGNFPIISQGSERIIVRASNPGQFESDVELCWQRGLTQDSIFHAGRVGINTDRPDESLVVHGNLKVSGHIVQPSDSRAKEEISELDTSVQLRNLQKIRIVRYRYAPEFAMHSGLKRAGESDSEEIVDTGVIAQEVREVIPDAVQEAGSIVLPNGNVIENFLLVNKDRILMENIGAVKELCKVTGSLEIRIEDLERNNRMVRQREFEQRSKKYRAGKSCSGSAGYEICTNKFLQIIILFLVIIMAACLAAVSTLYFVEHNKQSYNYKQLERLQFHSSGQLLGRDSLLINEQEGYIVQVHNILSRNKTVQNTVVNRIPSHQNNTHVPPELNYNESGELFSANGRNDELTVVMEKPLVSLQSLHSRKEAYKLTTTAPTLRINKTISSKNKSKWPQAQVVPKLIASFQNSRSTNAYIISPISTASETKADAFSKSNETSADKVADPVPLAHDFDNNSIDSDAQHISKSGLTNKGSAVHSSSSLESSLSEIEDSVEPIENSSSRTIYSVPETTIPTYNHKSTNNLHKTVSPPSTNVYLTTNKVAIDGLQTNYSIELAPISNKSQGGLENAGENVDSLDLQSLGNINESADNPTTALFGFDFGVAHESVIGRRSTSQADGPFVQNKLVHVDVFGAPAQCTRKLVVAGTTDCPTFCSQDSEQTNQAKLSDTKHDTINDKFNKDYQHILNSNIGGTEDDIEGSNLEEDAKTILTTNTSVNTNENRAQVVNAPIQHFEALDTLEHTYNSEEQLDIGPKSLEESNLPQLSGIDAPLKTQHDSNPTLKCWQIKSSIIVNAINQTIGLESFCPNNRKSLNVTYTLPLSKFFKESKFELHLRSSVPLLWSICSNQDYYKDKGVHFTPALPNLDSVTILQHQQNTTTLYINIPRHGYFIHKLSLRATDDSKTRNICEEKANEANTLLQYNFSIVRHCD